MAHAHKSKARPWLSLLAVPPALLLTAPAASAQSARADTASGATPDTGPLGTPVPVPPYGMGNEPTDLSGRMPPFNAPLPPAVPMPPPIRVAPATPPPQYETPTNPWSISTIPPRPAPPAPRQLYEMPHVTPQSAGGLRQALDEFDRRLGLGPGGSIVSAARGLAMGEPVSGSARLEIVVDASGRILRCAVVDASEDAADWRAFAEALQQEEVIGLRGKVTHGMWMLLDVSATNELSSGRTGWWAPGVALIFDVRDIGARRQRVVHANIASELSF